MKTSLGRVALFASLVVLMSSAALADSFAQPTTGTVPLGSYAAGPFDTINLANLNVHFSIPIVSKAGKGIPFNYSLSYDSSVWGINTDSLGHQQWKPVPTWGWRGVTEAATGYVTNGYSGVWERGCGDGQDRHFIETWGGFAYHDALGGTHPFGGRIRYCDGDEWSTFSSSTANDNSGYVLEPGPVQSQNPNLPTTILSSSGITITPPISNSTSGNGTVADPNGNILTVSLAGSVTTLTDTLGLPALTISGSAPNPPNCESSPVTYAYTAPNTGQARFTVGYRGYTVQTNFQVQDINEYGPTGQCLVDTVTRADGATYRFQYEQTNGSANTTGRLASVTLPTGGAISYGYGANNSMMADGSPAVMTWTWGGGLSSFGGAWTYNRSVRGRDSRQTWTRITDPGNNITDIFFSGIFATARTTYQGYTSILDYSYICYNTWTRASDCPTATVTQPITLRAVGDYPNYISWGATPYSGVWDYFDQYGNVTEELDYDYGTSTHALLRQSNISYDTNLCTRSLICDHAHSVQILDASAAQKALTNYTYDARGNTIQIDQWVNPSSTLTSRYDVNPNGTLKTATDPNGMVTHYDSTGYSCNGAFPKSVTVGPLQTQYTYNCTGGVVTSVTDSNHATVSTSYTDQYFWRPASTTDARQNVTQYTYYPTLRTVGQTESVMSWNGGGGSGSSTADSLTTPDNYGRAWLQQKRQAPHSNSFDTVQYWYDSSGRVLWLARPFMSGAGQPSGGGIPSTQYTYDALGRYKEITDWSGTQTDYSYNLNDLAVTVSPEPKSRQFQYDALGRVTSVCEISSSLGGACGQNTQARGYLTTYQTDPVGNLTSVSQSGQTRLFAYDGLSRMLSERNPENGTTSYSYDTDATCGTSMGDMVKRYDAAGNTTCYVSDGLHRLVRVTYPSGPNTPMPYKKYDYDVSSAYGIAVSNPVGRLVGAVTYLGGTALAGDVYSYDAAGNVTDLYEYRYDAGHGPWYHVQESYFASGAMASLQGFTGGDTSSPFSDLFTYSLDGEGRPYGMVDTTNNNNPIWTSTTYNTAGQPTAVVQAGGGGETFGYDGNSGRLTQWRSAAGSNSQTGNLSWSANGTLHQLVINDTVPHAYNATCTNGYDDLARLVSNSCTGTPVWSQSFSYDVYGNITTSGSFQATYDPNTNHVANLGFRYDADGNVLQDNVGNSFFYDAEGRQIQVTAGATTTSTIFDAFDRAAELDKPASRTQIIYAPGGAKFAYMSGQTLLKYMDPMVAGMKAVHNGDGTGYFMHTDWLGSLRLGVTSGGKVKYDRAYAPFGQAYAELNGDTTNRSFTGQTEDTTPGIYDFALREQSPIQGRWLVPDPAGLAAVDITNPQTWNRYGYVANNPLGRTDPLGLRWTEVCNGGIVDGGCPGGWTWVYEDDGHESCLTCGGGSPGGDPGRGGGGGGGGDDTGYTIRKDVWAKAPTFTECMSANVDRYSLAGALDIQNPIGKFFLGNSIMDLAFGDRSGIVVEAGQEGFKFGVGKPGTFGRRTSTIFDLNLAGKRALPDILGKAGAGAIVKGVDLVGNIQLGIDAGLALAAAAHCSPFSDASSNPRNFAGP